MSRFNALSISFAMVISTAIWVYRPDAGTQAVDPRLISAPVATCPPLPESRAVAQPSVVAAPGTRRGPMPKLSVPNYVKHAIIEVGTNMNPDLYGEALADPEALFVLVEPLTVNEAQTNGCRGMVERCVIVASAISNVKRWAKFRIATSSECSSLVSGGTGCGKERTQSIVSLTTLDDLIDQLPDGMPVKLLSLDCQGADFYAAASLRRNAHRVMALVHECQDLPLGDKLMIYGAESKNCGIIEDCVTKQLGFEFVRCVSNMHHVQEWNCVYIRPNAPLQYANYGRSLRTGYGAKSHADIMAVAVRGTCPMNEWNEQPDA